LRREESADRTKKPISQPNKKLLRAGGLGGRDYYPILEWKLADVWAAHRRSNFSEHSAVT
jgi:3'-phosphoadenosine 5'-phosphosulfate sulfotransferase (PAPS reductase)/FAD synthetase